MRKTLLALVALCLGLALSARPAASPAAPDTACFTTQPLACGADFDDATTADSPNFMESYACGGSNEYGPENVYALALPETSLPVTVIATLSNLTSDLDLFLLSAAGCDSDNCLAESRGVSDEQVQVDGLQGGSTVYLVVDGYAGAFGPYHLSVQCTGPDALALTSLQGRPSLIWGWALSSALLALAALFGLGSLRRRAWLNRV